jgi:hypothetical protein
MKNFKELSKIETIEIYGGAKVDYLKYSWSGTKNEIVYACEALYNLGILAANGGIWVWNQFQ